MVVSGRLDEAQLEKIPGIGLAIAVRSVAKQEMTNTVGPKENWSEGLAKEWNISPLRRDNLAGDLVIVGMTDQAVWGGVIGNATDLTTWSNNAMRAADSKAAREAGASPSGESSHKLPAPSA